jgi:hypothetical protein
MRSKQSLSETGATRGGTKKSKIRRKTPARPTVVMVLGHGPGVLALGNFFNRLGCDTGASRPQGADKIAEFNKAVLESAGAKPNHWEPFNSGWAASPKGAEFRNRALDLLRDELDGSFLSVIEAAGMARLLPFWNAVFDRAGVTPHYVLVIGEPAEISEGLCNDFGIDRRTGYLVWLREALEAEAHSRGRARAFVQPEQLSRAPAASLLSVCAALDLKLPRDIQATFASEGFESADFRELVGRVEELRRRRAFAPLTGDWVGATNQIIGGWASGGEAADSFPVLDAIREAFDEAAQVFMGTCRGDEVKELGTVVGKQALLFANEAADAEAEDLRKQIEAARVEAEEFRRVSVEKSQALDASQEELHARFTEIATLTRMLANETAAVRRLEQTARRLGAIAQALIKGRTTTRGLNWFKSLFPWRWHLKRAKNGLRRDGLFDPEAYLAANADVASAGVDPLCHYLGHGASEGRPLGID